MTSKGLSIAFPPELPSFLQAQPDPNNKFFTLSYQALPGNWMGMTDGSMIFNTVSNSPFLTVPLSIFSNLTTISIVDDTIGNVANNLQFSIKGSDVSTEVRIGLADNTIAVHNLVVTNPDRDLQLAYNSSDGYIFSKSGYPNQLFLDNEYSIVFRSTNYVKITVADANLSLYHLTPNFEQGTINSTLPLIYKRINVDLQDQKISLSDNTQTINIKTLPYSEIYANSNGFNVYTAMNSTINPKPLISIDLVQHYFSINTLGKNIKIYDNNTPLQMVFGPDGKTLTFDDAPLTGTKIVARLILDLPIIHKATGIAMSSNKQIMQLSDPGNQIFELDNVLFRGTLPSDSKFTQIKFTNKFSSKLRANDFTLGIRYEF